MIRRPPRSTLDRSSAASDVYKRQIKAMAEIGNPNSVSDAGVGALCARTAVIGAFLNVKINAGGLSDKELAANKIAAGEKIVAEAEKLEKEILEIVYSKIK